LAQSYKKWEKITCFLKKKSPGGEAKERKLGGATHLQLAPGRHSTCKKKGGVKAVGERSLQKSKRITVTGEMARGVGVR